ncbi:biotin synthase [Alteromonas macleodii]|jgi:biotin synthase|uniref:Biotin synthase n=2 Tax=Alteromonas macleodii TaxID=28108 RepID=A0A126PY31_ALTMA|nr:MULTISPECIES: biotin synthase BioB [Alteromonas]MDY6977103.1 biotin synthase BioB [Pseudomonadota bacterium]AFT73963.1 biotin synthase [Alteromonas macleodii str. 'English Channel 673']AFT94789.1 biotin synthase [Alteromonas macleodii str. 'Balearic Sea AD45']AMJ97936.1 biotin synthase [Alteromonas macleodii]MAN42912.1 biotin synthase BioB [Alteromonas sp.]|tara:strand:+ start:17534 stop:18658 length:1125 start_codon:yes stop_codon:yes gene_type:complete
MTLASAPSAQTTTIRNDWTKAEVEALFAMPFNDLLFNAQVVHRQHFNPNEVQVSTLLSIKTGACPEDCKYCPQSARYDTGLEKERLLEIEKVIQRAKEAKQVGSTRFCMGAAWRNPRDRDMPYILKMVEEVKSLGLETCMTLGMLTRDQAVALKQAGLDYYNHNLDTSPEYYGDIITTRTYQDRLNTLENVRAAGMNVCSGGIVGMGETVSDRASMLVQLANLPEQPQSVPINMLVKVKGTPLDSVEDLDYFEFIRTIAVARIMMPKSHVRLSAGREAMNEQMQALCFMAGANSIFYGCKLLTTSNPDTHEDVMLFKKLGINTERTRDYSDEAHQQVLEEEIAQQQEQADDSNDLFIDATKPKVAPKKQHLTEA